MSKNFAVIGVGGYIAPRHLRAIRDTGNRIVAAVDIKDSVGVLDQYSFNTRFFTEIERFDRHLEKLRRGTETERVHFVSVCSPNYLHDSHCRLALRIGADVICEKPLAMTSKETAQLVKLAASRPDQVFAVNYNLRFYPAVLQLRAAVQRGDLGDIFHVNGSYMQDWLLKDTDYNWRLLPNEGGALRAVSDIGTHWMDAASFILGSKISEVYAQLETLHKTRKRPLGEVQTYSKAGAAMKYDTYPVQTEDYAAVLLRWGSGVFGSVNVSQVAAGRKNCLRLEIYGSKKSACWNSEEPNSIQYGSRDGANELSLRGSPGFMEDVAGFSDYPGGHAEGFPDAFKMNMRAVYTAISTGKKPAIPFASVEDGHHEVKVCDAILKSSKTRKWVKV